MAYQFAGFFIKGKTHQLLELPNNAVVRQITSPFDGFGMRLPAYIGQTVTMEDVLQLSNSIGVSQSAEWIFIQYDCFGGQIDSVSGVTCSQACPSPYKEDSNYDTVQQSFLNLMQSFGVDHQDAINFPPFKRGFWGDK
jgi:hypothetical protein